MFSIKLNNIMHCVVNRHLKIYNKTLPGAVSPAFLSLCSDLKIVFENSEINWPFERVGNCLYKSEKD